MNSFRKVTGSRVFYYVALAVILLLQLLCLIYFGSLKQGFHQDEYYSYYSSNRTAGLFEPDREWVDTDTIRNEFMVLEGEQFRYSLVAQVQSWDVHPPLYYDILHTVCSLSVGIFSKWQGIAVNIMAFIICFFLLYILSKMMGMKPYARLLLCAVWGFHPMTVSCVMFIRMYMWLTVFVLLCSVLYIRMIQYYKSIAASAASEYDYKQHGLISFSAGYLLPVIVCGFLGFLTQYYYLIFFFFIAFGFMIYQIREKRPFKEVALHIAACFVSMGAAVAAYPASVVHILRGYRGKEAVGEFISAANLPSRMMFFIGLLDKDVLGNCLIILIAVVVAGLILFKVRIKAEKAIICFACTGYFLIVAKTALILGESSNRYEMPVYPLIIMLSIIAICALIPLFAEKLNFGKYFHICMIVFAAVILLMDMKGLFLNEDVLFLYQDEKADVENAGAQAESGTPALIAYNEASPENVWRFTNQILEYQKVYFINEANQEPITDTTITEAKGLEVYAADYDNGEFDRDDLLAQILSDCKSLNEYSPVSHRDMWTLYEFR